MSLVQPRHQYVTYKLRQPIVARTVRWQLYNSSQGRALSCEAVSTARGNSGVGPIDDDCTHEIGLDQQKTTVLVVSYSVCRLSVSTVSV